MHPKAADTPLHSIEVDLYPELDVVVPVREHACVYQALYLKIGSFYVPLGSLDQGGRGLLTSLTWRKRVWTNLFAPWYYLDNKCIKGLTKNERVGVDPKLQT